MKTCPYCAEQIKEEAIKCKHCQSNLQSTKDNDLKRNTKTVVLTVIKLFLGASFGLFIFIIFIFVISEILFQMEASETAKKAEKAQQRAE